MPGVVGVCCCVVRHEGLSCESHAVVLCVMRGCLVSHMLLCCAS
jgi:hypothetical protein